MAGIPQNEHLKKIEDDQSISGIERIMATIRNGIDRKWFVSQGLSAKIAGFVYNSRSGRIEVNSGEHFHHQDSAVQAAHTLTCPAGRIYRVYFMTSVDNTTATSYSLTGTHKGNAVTYKADDGTDYAINEIATNINKFGQLTFDLGGNPHNTAPEILLWPGDTLTITATNWFAGDTVTVCWFYEEYIAPPEIIPNP